MKPVASLLVFPLLLSFAPVRAAVPEQFQVWGTAGPMFPAAPAGWQELSLPADTQAGLQPTPQEQRQGYILFARDPFDLMNSTTVPAPSERTQRLNGVTARGGYVSLSFGIHALAPLEGLRISAGDFHAANGAALSRENVDIRVVRSIRVPVPGANHVYEMRPFLLEKRGALSIPGGTTAQIWITIKTPEAAAPGEYAGGININDQPALTAAVRILPIDLPPSPAPLSLYFSPPASNEMLHRELVDLREHGVLPADLLGTQIASRDRHFGEDDVAQTIAENNRIMQEVGKVFGKLHFPQTYAVGNQITEFWDPVKNWFNFAPHSPAIDADFLKAVQIGIDQGQKAGWPPLRIYALDEAGAHSLLDEAVYYYGLLKAHYPTLSSYTTIGGGIAMGHDELGQLSNVVDMLDTNRFTPEIAHALAARGKPFGVYNGCRTTPASARYFFGFYGWKTAAGQVSQWGYHFGDAPFKGNGMRSDDEGYVYEGPDGPIPSVMLEAVRQGADDYRFTVMLWHRIYQARASGKPGGKAAADSAEKTLQSVLDEIPMSVQGMSVEDSTPAPPDSVLRKWRLRIAREILSLEPFISTQTASSAAVKTASAAGSSFSPIIREAKAETVISPAGGIPKPRLSDTSPGPIRSPFDFNWAEPKAAKETFGDELLPPVDFAVNLRPWQVQAWTGKGAGEADTGERHDGHASVKIVVPAVSGNEAVTVLVWPSWGDGKLNLTLEGSRTYELSAWVKMTGRGTPPEMRINLPARAAGLTRSGKDAPAADGWQRIWTRTAVNFPAAPTYLAAWVQGPGTVWIADLSLREVTLPPVTLTMDQTEFDGEDHTAAARMSIAPGITPDRIRVTLAPENGPPSLDLTTPFRAHAAIASAGTFTLSSPVALQATNLQFNPAALAPGVYWLKAVLLDPDGKEIGASTIRLTRLVDESWPQ